ncbi:VanZ family protein [Streptomyces sp. NPDC006422]|uniref:VanZ family protein n=1 Tax=unclassified Streptomyces TaxID=2593676 RepID=UPI0033BCF3E3
MSHGEHAAVMGLLVLGLVGVAFAVRGPLARRAGLPPAATLGMLVAAAFCLGLTLPDQVQEGASARLDACLTGASVRAFPGGPAHHAFNVVAWVPLGLYGALATRRPVAFALAGSAAWALVEVAQTLDPERSCQPVDWLNNSVGVLAGALVGTFLLARGRLRLTAER